MKNGIAFFFILFVVTFVINAVNPPKRDPAYDPNTVENKARLACLIVLKSRLHDPDGAQLDDTFRWYAGPQKNGTILVQPSGRAKNAFGALRYSEWDCITKGAPNGERADVLTLTQLN